MYVTTGIMLAINARAKGLYRTSVPTQFRRRTPRFSCRPPTAIISVLNRSMLPVDFARFNRDEQSYVISTDL